MPSFSNCTWRCDTLGCFDSLQAARELALYFSDRQCTLAKLVLSKADVDDFEAS